MASYFDHFIVTKVITDYITDSSIIMVSVIIMYMVLSRHQYIIPSRFQSILEITVSYTHLRAHET